MDRRLAELAPQSQRIAALEADLAALRRQIVQSANRAREEVRRELDAARKGFEKSEEAQRRILAELEKVRQARDSGERRNAELVTKTAALLERMEQAAARNAETARRIGTLERELAEAKAGEARAREQESEAALLRETAERRRAEIERLEEARKDQDRELKELRDDVADLERMLEDASVAEPAAAQVEVEPPAPEPEEDELFPSGERITVDPEPSPEPEPEPEPEPVEAEEVPAESAAVEPIGGASAPADVTLEAAKAALDPRNLFGPDADDGRPNYVLLEQLSRDAMGAVYRAYERAGGGQFAVRFLPAQEDEEKAEAIEREVQKLIGLPHPNILPVLGSGRRENEVYVEMDLVQAEPIGKAQIREIPRLCLIFRDVADAVHYAHEEGVIHGDLNPETVLLGRDEGGDHAYVKDFGLAHQLESFAPPSASKQPSLTIRNPAFLPPEQMKDARGALSVATDVYGLGSTLYSVLVGRPPFDGKDVRQVRSRVMIEEPPPLESIRLDAPMALAVVIRRAMAKEARLRYATAREFADALTGFLEGKGTKILSRPASPKGR